MTIFSHIISLSYDLALRVSLLIYLCSFWAFYPLDMMGRFASRSGYRIESLIEPPLGRTFDSMVSASGFVSDLSFKFRKTTHFVFFALTALFLVMNLPQYTVRKGILDGTLLSGNRTRINNEYVRNKLGWDEYLGFAVKFPNGIRTAEDLEKLRSIHEKLKEVFKDNVVSMANYPLQRGMGPMRGKVVSGYCIPKDAKGLDIDEWKSVIEETRDVYGYFVERNWKLAYFAINLDAGYDEYNLFFKIKEIFEERTIGKFQRYLETDIVPKDKSILIGSWITSRTTIFLTLYRNMIVIVCMGFLMAGGLAYGFTQSKSQALYMALIYLVSIVWTRGSIGLLHKFGVPIYERVFILATFTNNIVQGMSFGLHKIEEFNRRGSWNEAKKVDPLLLYTAIVAIYGFLTLLSFRDNSIREMGVSSAIGVFHIYCLTVFFLPAMARFKRSVPEETRTGKFVNGIVLGMARGCTRTSEIPARYYIWGLSAMLFVSAVLVAGGKLPFGSTPYSYIEGKQSEKSAKEIGLPGNIGPDALHLTIEPSDLKKGDEDRVREPEFLKKAMEFQHTVEIEAWGARRVYSLVNIIEENTLVKFGQEVPETSFQWEDAFYHIDESDKFPKAFVKGLYYSNGLRMVVFAALDNSRKQGSFIKSVLDIAQRNEFSELNVREFGKVPTYYQHDRNVVIGKPINILTSQAGIIVLSFLFIIIVSRQAGSRRLSPWKGSLAMSSPFLFGLSFMALVMIGMKIPLDSSTGLITSLSINAACDFSIYFVFQLIFSLVHLSVRASLNEAMEMEGTVISKDVFLNMFCFIPLAIFAGFSPIRNLGWMIAAMLFSIGFASLVIMVSILRQYCIRKEA